MSCRDRAPLNATERLASLIEDQERLLEMVRREKTKLVLVNTINFVQATLKALNAGECFEKS